MKGKVLSLMNEFLNGREGKMSMVVAFLLFSFSENKKYLLKFQ